MSRPKKVSRPKKKVILFIVEGKSDQEALERPIQDLLLNNTKGLEAVFLTADCDVTSDSRHNPDNIQNKINKFFLEPFFSANEYYYPKDIYEVVHICDLDGAFIPDDFCKKYDESHFAESGFIYDSLYIYGATAEAVQDRNHRKAKNIDFLRHQYTIKVKTKMVPYSIYFFSANIDHYLYDKLNLLARYKIEKAAEFADQCENDQGYFLKRICEHSQAIKDKSYEESWDYIMEENNSIKRHTNFNIYIMRLLELLNSDEAL